MFRKKKLFILIPVLLLIPLLVGMIPLKLVNKLAHGGPYAQCQDKQGCGQKNCSAHSLISQNHFDAAPVGGTSPVQELTSFQKALCAVPESIHSNTHPISTPLRC